MSITVEEIYSNPIIITNIYSRLHEVFPFPSHPVCPHWCAKFWLHNRYSEYFNRGLWVMNNDSWKEIMMKHRHGPGCIPFPVIFPQVLPSFWVPIWVGLFLSLTLSLTFCLTISLTLSLPTLPPSPAAAVPRLVVRQRAGKSMRGGDFAVAAEGDL